jgi:hypothetical protein
LISIQVHTTYVRKHFKFSPQTLRRIYFDTLVRVSSWSFNFFISSTRLTGIFRGTFSGSKQVLSLSGKCITVNDVVDLLLRDEVRPFTSPSGGLALIKAVETLLEFSNTDAEGENPMMRFV